MANPAFFTRIYLDADDHITTESTPSYRLLLDPNVQKRALIWASLPQNGEKRSTRTLLHQLEGPSETRGLEVMPPNTNRVPTVAGGWIRVGGRKLAEASVLFHKRVAY